MKKLLILILLFSGAVQSQTPLHNLARRKITPGGFVADSAQFTFSLDNTTETAVSGWVQLQPNPNAAILTGSQNGYSISTVATGDANWNDNGLAASAGAVTNSTANSPFPAGVGTGYFFHASTTFVSGGHLRITCPSADAYYDVYVWSLRPTVTDNRLSKIQCIGRYETRTRNSVNSAPSSATSNDSLSRVTSGGTWVRFKDVRPDASNYVFVNAAAETGNTFGYVNAIKIVKRSDIAPPEPEPQPIAFNWDRIINNFLYIDELAFHAMPQHRSNLYAYRQFYESKAKMDTTFFNDGSNTVFVTYDSLGQVDAIHNHVIPKIKFQ